MEQTPTIPAEADRLREEFSFFDDWRDRVEHIIELGKELPALDDVHKTEANRVRGCQSQVWLTGEFDQTSRTLSLAADSDAIVVRGLIALLLRLYDGRAPAEIVANPPEVLKDIGLDRFLTPGRSNGLYAMVARIRQLAEIYAAVPAPTAH